MERIHDEEFRGNYRFTFTDEYGRMLEVQVTEEGVIIDAYEDGGEILVGTIGRMADEWFEYVEGSGS